MTLQLEKSSLMNNDPPTTITVRNVALHNAKYNLMSDLRDVLWEVK